LRALAGEVPLRLRPGGFAGMAHIVVSQLLSVQSARTIHARLEALLVEVSAGRFVATADDELRACGLSGGKIRTLREVAAAEADGRLDYALLANLPAEDALASLTRLKGVGPWTAEIYLLFCTGHPDIFPAGDLALRKMIAHVTGAAALPDERLTRQTAEAWAPCRASAARLLWQAFGAMRKREGGGV